MRLQGQVAVVTGASSGIGRASALALAAEGANVALVARRKTLLEGLAAEIEALGAEALVCPADVTDPAAVEAVFKAILDRFGRIDVLLNSAGTNAPERSISDVTPAVWKEVVDASLTSTYLCIRSVLPAMRTQGSGLIISISSLAGRRPSTLSGVAYSAAKHAVVSLNESVNLENRSHGVRACVICPGEVATPILDRRPYPPSPAARAAMLQPEDLAAAVVFVATLPPRATVEELNIRPTVIRDRSEDQRVGAASSQR